ncbi:glycosyltransferase [soil metagenome]
MAHFLLAPSGSHGDVHPYIAIGQALLARGHTVKMSTSQHFESLAVQAGFEFAAVGTEADFQEMTNDPNLWHPSKSLTVLFGNDRFDRMMRQNYAQLNNWIHPGETVIVAGSLAVAARLLNEKRGVPLATVHLQPMAMPSISDPPRFPGPSPEWWWPRWLVRACFWYGERRIIDPIMAPYVNGFRQDLGLAPISRIWGRWRHSPDCCLGLFPDWFGKARDWPAHMHLTGFVQYDQADTKPISAELDAFLNSGEPPVVISFGSAMQTGTPYFAAAVEACNVLGKRGLILARDGEQIPKSLPKSILHVPYAPFSHVFPRACAVVHHGGVGTSAQAMKAGVPQLVMPLAFDQFDNAERLKKLGVARSVPASKFTAKTATKALQTLLTDATMPVMCRELQAKMQADPLPETVRILESLVGRDRK